MTFAGLLQLYESTLEAVAFFFIVLLVYFMVKLLSFKSGSKEAEVINQRIQEINKKERTIDLSFIFNCRRVSAASEGCLPHCDQRTERCFDCGKTTRSNTRASIGIPLARLSDSF